MYRQPRDSFEARIYTREYRIYGNIYLVQAGGTAELLNAENRTHIPVTGALVYMAGLEHPPPDQRTQSRYPLYGSQQRRHLLDGGRSPLGAQRQPGPV